MLLPALLYIAVMTPFRVFFANQARRGSTIWWVEVTLDLLFLFDILVNFSTGYIVTTTSSEDAVEYDPRRVAGNYLKTWFPLDRKRDHLPVCLSVCLFACLGDASLICARCRRLFPAF